MNSFIISKYGWNLFGCSKTKFLELSFELGCAKTMIFLSGSLIDEGLYEILIYQLRDYDILGSSFIFSFVMVGNTFSFFLCCQTTNPRATTTINNPRNSLLSSIYILSGDMP